MGRDSKTVTKRFRTENPAILKVVIGEIGAGNLIFAKRTYYEVKRGDEKILAMDYTSAEAALME